MIKLYCDWNVMNQMKNGKQADLLEILLTDRFFVPYSTAHIGDIYESYIEEDISFITKLTGEMCLYNENKKIVAGYCSPRDLVEQRLDSKDHFKNLNFKNIKQRLIDNEPYPGAAQKVMESFQASGLDTTVQKLLEDPKKAAGLEKLFPGISANPTVEGIFDGFGKMLNGMNEGAKYKDMRQMVQSGLAISRDQIIDSKNPYELIEKAYEKANAAPIEYGKNAEHAPKWYNEITSEYILLDMHGYQEDKVNIEKGRKETFKNTTEDAFHAAFASTCNFYITSDNKSYRKTKQVYEKLGINTLVMKPEEFLEHFAKFLNLENPQLHLALVEELIKNGKFEQAKLDDCIQHTYRFPYFLFYHFNKIRAFYFYDGKKPLVMLTQELPTNGFVHFIEIKTLVSIMLGLYGSDIDGLGELTDGEIYDGNLPLRKWKIGELTLRLIYLGGYLQLYLDFDPLMVFSDATTEKTEPFQK